MSRDIKEYYNVPNCQISGLIPIYMGIFGYRENGFFVDVGSYNGIDYSNVYGLAKAGWEGVMFEPVRKFYNQCVERYKEFPRVKINNIGIGNKKEQRKLFFGDHGSCTFSEDFVNKCGRQWYSSIETGNLITLDSALEEYIGKKIDILSIDTEGYEPEVLEGFSIDNWIPSLVIVEAHELHIEDDRPILHPQINTYFDQHGYRKIYSDSINNIYIPKNSDLP